VLSNNFAIYSCVQVIVCILKDIKVLILYFVTGYPSIWSLVDLIYVFCSWHHFLCKFRDFFLFELLWKLFQGWNEGGGFIMKELDIILCLGTLSQDCLFFFIFFCSCITGFWTCVFAPAFKHLSCTPSAVVFRLFFRLGFPRADLGLWASYFCLQSSCQSSLAPLLILNLSPEIFDVLSCKSRKVALKENIFS
jgi:hypothetical protein